MNIVEALRDWTPIWIGAGPEGAWVDWCRAEAECFDEPFYDGTVQRLLQRPFNRLFQHRTPLQALPQFADAIPGGEPAGFIFHMSRCGSTLISRALAALDGHTVISEGEPLERLLLLLEANPNLAPELKRDLLRGLMGAFSHARPDSERLFVKFDAWQVHYLPLLRRTFPATPWVFVYRDPLQVMVSQARALSTSLTPGILPLHLAGVTPEAAGQTDPLEFVARALGGILNAAHRGLDQESGGMPLHYDRLPDALWQEIPGHFGLELDPTQRDRIAALAGADAKDPGRPFADDRAGKRAEADERITKLTQRWLEQPYAALAKRHETKQELIEPPT